MTSPPNRRSYRSLVWLTIGCHLLPRSTSFVPSVSVRLTPPRAFLGHASARFVSSSSSQQRQSEDEALSWQYTNTSSVDTLADRHRPVDDWLIPNLEDPEVAEIVRIRPEESAVVTAPASEASADESEINRARWLLIGAAALYGTNFSLVKLLGESMPIGLSSTLRFGMAALVTLPWLVWPSSITSKDDTKSSGDQSLEWASALAGFEVGLWNAAGYVAQAVGLETTDASQSAFLCSLAVVIVPLLDYVGLGKKLSSRQVGGALLALVGVALLELGDTTFSWTSTGDLASLLQPLVFGFGFWRMEAAMTRYPSEAARCTAAQLLAVFVASVVYTLVTDAGSFSTVPMYLQDPTMIGALVWTGVVTTALTIYMETLALKSLSAAETTLIFSTEPLWGTAFAAVVMGEQLGAGSAVGAVCILCGCVYANLGLDGLRQWWEHRKPIEMKPVFRQPQSFEGRPEESSSTYSDFERQTNKASSGRWSLMWSDAAVAGRLLIWQLADILQRWKV